MLELSREPGLITLRFPAHFYPAADIQLRAGESGYPLEYSLRDEAADRVLELRAADDVLDRAVQDLFSRLNGYRSYAETPVSGYRPPARPLVSCVIVMTANDIFTQNQLVPSIVANGVVADLEPFRALTVLTSEFGCVAKAYNAGAQRARGEYLAFFHDDCILQDREWIAKSLALLEQGETAVTPEIDHILATGLPNAKDVPLVISRENFFARGGYDENYYLGYEDLDFTHTLLRTGRPAAVVPLDYVHAKGMSTIIMHSKKPDLFRYLFGLNIIPKDFMPKLRTFYFGQLQRNLRMQLLVRRELEYFLDKFADYFIATSQAGVLAQERAYIATLAPGEDTAFMQDRASYIAYYRKMVDTTEDFSLV